MMDKNDLHKTATGEQGSKWSRGGQNAPGGSRGLSPVLIAWLVILAVSVIFFFRNGEQTKLDFLFITTHNKTRWLVIVCIAIGVVLDRLFSMWWHRRRRAKALEN